MSFTDFLTFAVSNIDADIPAALLPMAIYDSAALAAHLSPDMEGGSAWN
jgi:hypothetical protein